MFRTRVVGSESLRDSVGGKGEYDQCIKIRVQTLSVGRGDWGQLGHGETRGKWWPTLTKVERIIARPSKRGDFLGTNDTTRAKRN